MTRSERTELKNKYNASKINSKKYYKFVSENKGDLLEIFGPDSAEYKSIILVPNKAEEAVIAKDEGRRAVNNYLMQKDNQLKGSGIKAVDQSAKEILKNQDDTAEKLKLVNKIISKDESLVENKIAAEEADKLLKDLGISKKDTASLNLFAKDLQKSVDRSNRIRGKWANYPTPMKLGASFLIPRMADKWEQGYDADAKDIGLDALELGLGPVLGVAAKTIKHIPKAAKFSKNLAKLRDKGVNWLKVKSTGVPYVGEVFEKAGKGLGPAVGAQLGMMSIDENVYDDTPLNRGNYSLGDYVAAAGMGTFINSIGKRGITQREREKLAKIDDAIDKYSVYPKRLNKEAVALDKAKYNKKMDDLFEGISDNKLADYAIERPAEEFLMNYSNKIDIDPDDARTLKTILTQIPEEEIVKYAKKNNMDINDAYVDLIDNYKDFVNSKHATLLQEKAQLDKHRITNENLDKMLEKGNYFTEQDIENTKEAIEKLKDIKNKKEMSLFEKNLDMLPTMGGYYLTDIANRVGMLNNKGEYVVPEDQFENEEINASDIRRLYEDLKKSGKLKDSTKLTPEERYIIDEYHRMK